MTRHERDPRFLLLEQADECRRQRVFAVKRRLDPRAIGLERAVVAHVEQFAVMHHGPLGRISFAVLHDHPAAWGHRDLRHSTRQVFEPNLVRSGMNDFDRRSGWGFRPYTARGAGESAPTAVALRGVCPKNAVNFTDRSSGRSWLMVSEDKL